MQPTSISDGAYSRKIFHLSCNKQPTVCYGSNFQFPILFGILEKNGFPIMHKCTYVKLLTDHLWAKPIPYLSARYLCDTLYFNPQNTLKCLVAKRFFTLLYEKSLCEKQALVLTYIKAWFQEHSAGVDPGSIAGRSFYTSLGHLNETWKVNN